MATQHFTSFCFVRVSDAQELFQVGCILLASLTYHLPFEIDLFVYRNTV